VKGGVNVLEFVPKGIDKGQGIEKLMKTPAFKGKKPIYFGDSQGDIPALGAIYQNLGHAVSIGSKASFWGSDVKLRDEMLPVSGIKEHAQSKLLEVLKNHLKTLQTPDSSWKFTFRSF